MPEERNPQDKSAPTDLQQAAILMPQQITPDVEDRAFNYTIIPISLAAALADLEVEMQGEKIYYMEGQSRVRIKIETATADSIELYPGRRIVCPFKRFYLTAPAADEIIKLCVASPSWVEVHGEGVEVNQLIRDKSQFRETELQRAFTGSDIRTAVVGEFCGIQLWNPSDSGIIAICRSAMLSVYSPNFNYGLTTTQLATLEASSTGNKYSGGPTPQCEIRTDTDAVNTNILPAADRIGMAMRPDPDTMTIFPYDDRIILLPGYGFTYQGQATNTSIMAQWEWLELPEDDISGF